MPLHIVRNDIILMHVDAIVNSTNEWLIPGGTGVDASIHAAAGSELGSELFRISHCAEGSAVITASYNITSCRHIIHAVSPVYRGGTHGEEALLTSCYRKIFALAEENGCGSIAMPVLCSGANGYPRTEAYRIAAKAAREYLAGCEDEMKIYLVVFSREMTDVSLGEGGDVTQYITDAYSRDKRQDLNERFTCTLPQSMLINCREDEESYSACAALTYDEEDEICLADVADDTAMNYALMQPCTATEKKSGWKAQREEKIKGAIGAAMPQAVSAAPTEDYRKADLSFGLMCDWWMERKGIKISDFYNRANITKGTYSNLRKKTGAVPKKRIALACVVGLRLNMEEANDLLGRAGLAFSKYYEMDRIVKMCIEKGEYNIDNINWILMEEMPDGETLGSGCYDKEEKAG